MTARAPAPVALNGRHVILEPLRIDHVPDLYAAQRGVETDWGWLPVLAPRSQAEMRLIVEQRLAQQAAGGAFLFAVLDARTRRAAGWIAYLNINVIDQRVDIGWHWLGESLSGTYATVEIHLLLVQHAFHLGFSRVEWQLDDLDRAGHDTMLQIGALREGLLRRHQKRPDGTWRDTALYALLSPSRAAPPGQAQLAVPAAPAPAAPAAPSWPAPSPVPPQGIRPRVGLPPAGHRYGP
ncbi:GNAT family N-acetyltransferase [Streptomyces sp. WMMB 322]|uniref:GNAT family N-acetyltransferase n=1 Tax=Streptomyces sp. WMMB 322 TaxID=1286821 RepID=UPI000823C844|nr:GNAT family N-acetyltransferase [Streptomyces sp. WMMB 322]SCK30760.1 Protein N-acetyltransferase, RimJ/RimL family [Streptomyces sp. WMMB 322]